MPRARTRSTTTIHVAALVAARLVAAVASAVTGLIVPRALPVAEYGQYGVAVALAGLLVVLSDLGLTSSLARFTAAGRADMRVARRTVVLRCGAAMVAGLLLLLYGMLFASSVGGSVHGNDTRLPPFLQLAGALVVANSMLGVATGLLPALRRIRVLVVITMATPVLELAGMVTALRLGGSGGSLIIASVLATATMALVGLVTVAVAYRASSRLDDEAQATVDAAHSAGLRQVLGYSRAMFIVTVSYALFGVVDQLVIWAIHGSARAAHYIAAWRLITLLHLPGLAAATVVAPRLAVGGRDSRRLFARWLAALGTAYIGIVAIAMALADRIVPVALGDRYEAAVPVFLGLGLYALLLGIAPHATMAANYLGGAGRRIQIGVSTVAANLVLDLLLIPRLGLAGACIATSIAFSWYVVSHVRLSWRLLEGTPLVAALRPAPTILRTVASVSALAGGAALAGAGARGAYFEIAFWSNDVVGVIGAGLVGLMIWGAIVGTGWRLRRWLLPEPILDACAPTVAPTNDVRVLHICDFSAPYPGAFIRQLRMLHERLQSNGSEQTTVVALPERARGRAWIDQLHGDGIDVRYLPEPASLPSRQLIRDVEECIRAVGAEIVHSHFGTYDIAVSRAVAAIRRSGIYRRPTGARSRPPVQIWHYRTALETSIDARSLGRRVRDLIKFRLAGSRVDACIGVTVAMADEASARGMGRRAIAVVAGCDTDTFRPDDATRLQVRRELGLASDDVMILHMGWAWYRKGGDLLAAALRSLPSTIDGHSVRAWSVGASADDVEPPVNVLEPSEEIHRLHQAADIFVSASRSEGFGNGLVEAMACGRVVIAALADGQVEVFDNLPGCITVPVDSAPAIAEAIQQLMSCRSEWNELGHENRVRVVTRYSMRRWAAQMSTTYDGLINGLAAPEAVHRDAHVGIEAGVARGEVA